MADKTIGELPAASEVFDDSLLVMEQQGEARSVRGELVKKYAVAAVQVQADAAKTYADDAKKSQDAAAESAKDAADVALHPPILKAGTDHWWTWSTEANDYVESEYDAGVSIEVLPDVISVGPDEPARVENLGTDTDPRYQFYLKQGDPGADGVDGFSPTVEVTKVGKDTTITITDAEGPHVATVRDGEAAIPDHLIVGEDSELPAVMPVNADTLEGHNAEYFVTKTDLNTELAKKQDVLPYYSNPNLLDNWYFIGGGSQQGSGQFPINQRGQTEYKGLGYSVDRWYINDGNQKTFPVTADASGLVLSAALDWMRLEQMIEKPTRLNGHTLTFSILVKNPHSTVRAVIRNKTNSTMKYEGISAQNGVGLCSVTVDSDILQIEETNQVIVAIYPNVDEVLEAKVTLIAAKLEFGSQQTLAHQENGEWVLNEVPDYAAELAKCQRYYWNSMEEFASNVIATDIGTKNVLLCNVQFPVRMRATPSVTITSINGTPGVLSYYASRVDSAVHASALSSTLDAEGFSLLQCDDLTDYTWAFKVIADANL